MKIEFIHFHNKNLPSISFENCNLNKEELNIIINSNSFLAAEKEITPSPLPTLGSPYRSSSLSSPAYIERVLAKKNILPAPRKSLINKIKNNDSLSPALPLPWFIIGGTGVGALLIALLFF